MSSIGGVPPSLPPPPLFPIFGGGTERERGPEREGERKKPKGEKGGERERERPESESRQR